MTFCNQLITSLYNRYLQQMTSFYDIFLTSCLPKIATKQQNEMQAQLFVKSIRLITTFCNQRINSRYSTIAAYTLGDVNISGDAIMQCFVFCCKLDKNRCTSSRNNERARA